MPSSKARPSTWLCYINNNNKTNKLTGRFGARLCHRCQMTMMMMSGKEEMIQACPPPLPSTPPCSSRSSIKEMYS